MFRRRIAPTALAVAIAATAFVAAPSRPGTVFAASGSIAVSPATQPVAPGSTFVVTLVQSAAGGTAGAQATVTFDPSIIQLQDIQPGPAYASATLLFGRVPGSDTGQAGQPQTPDEAKAEANQTGVLLNAATFLNPGTGSVPGGDTPFLLLTLQAVAAAGTSPIRLSKMEMLDDQYNSLVVSGTDGSVVIGGAGAPPPAATIGAPPTVAPGATPPAAAQTSPAAGATTPLATKTALSGVAGASKAPSLKSASFAVSPATQKVAKEATFSFAVTQKIDGAASNAQANVVFKRDLVEIVKLVPGSGWKGDSKVLDAAMSDANSSGELKLILTADKDKGPAASGESTLVTVTMKGRTGKEGKSSIKLIGTDITGSDGSSVPPAVTDGEVIVGSAGGGSNTLLLAVAAVVAVVVLGGGGAAFAMKRARGS